MQQSKKVLVWLWYKNNSAQCPLDESFVVSRSLFRPKVWPLRRTVSEHSITSRYTVWPILFCKEKSKGINDNNFNIKKKNPYGFDLPFWLPELGYFGFVHKRLGGFPWAVLKDPSLIARTLFQTVGFSSKIWVSFLSANISAETNKPSCQQNTYSKCEKNWTPVRFEVHTEVMKFTSGQWLSSSGI